MFSPGNPLMSWDMHQTDVVFHKSYFPTWWRIKKLPATLIWMTEATNKWTERVGEKTGCWHQFLSLIKKECSKGDNSKILANSTSPIRDVYTIVLYTSLVQSTSSVTISKFNSTIAESHINLSDKELFWKYFRWSVNRWNTIGRDQIYPRSFK